LGAVTEKKNCRNYFPCGKSRKFSIFWEKKQKNCFFFILEKLRKKKRRKNKEKKMTEKSKN